MTPSSNEQELESFMFEELQPVALVAKRNVVVPIAEGEDAEKAKQEAKPAGVEYLVHWGDGTPDTWEPERNIADDVIADFEAGLEYASAAAIVSQRRAGGRTEYLVRWEDGAEPSWQEEEQIDEGVMRQWLDIRGTRSGDRPPQQRKESRRRRGADEKLSVFDPLVMP
jgi:hypothetical protein